MLRDWVGKAAVLNWKYQASLVTMRTFVPASGRVFVKKVECTALKKGHVAGRHLWVSKFKKKKEETSELEKPILAMTNPVLNSNASLILFRRSYWLEGVFAK